MCGSGFIWDNIETVFRKETVFFSIVIVKIKFVIRKMAGTKVAVFEGTQSGPRWLSILHINV